MGSPSPLKSLNVKLGLYRFTMVKAQFSLSFFGIRQFVKKTGIRLKNWLHRFSRLPAIGPILSIGLHAFIPAELLSFGRLGEFKTDNLIFRVQKNA